MTDATDKMESLLAAMWLRILPLVQERLKTLDRAAEAATAGILGEEQREAAADCAHKLAGSLGMYGYDDGTRIARQIELLLDYATPDAARLSNLVAELRRAISQTSRVSAS
jgi:HPt (histidine-containing phosphotransfer) domain-containing protein